MDDATSRDVLGAHGKACFRDGGVKHSHTGKILMRSKVKGRGNRSVFCFVLSLLLFLFVYLFIYLFIF